MNYGRTEERLFNSDFQTCDFFVNKFVFLFSNVWKKSVKLPKNALRNLKKKNR